MTYENLLIAVKDYLKNNLTETVEFGKYDVNAITALESPAVYIYAEPVSNNNLQNRVYYREARFSIFTTAAMEDPTLAIFSAIKLAENVERLMLDFPEGYTINYDNIETPFSFDSFYSDKAVCLYQFNIPYQPNLN